MARLVALSSLTLQAQQRADMANSTFLSASEWTTNINNSATALYDLLTGSFEDYYIKQQQLIVSSSAFIFLLPTDFYKLCGIDLLISGSVQTDGSTGQLYVNGQTISVKPYNFQQRNSYTAPTINNTLIESYIPSMPALVNPGDTFDGINGWEEWIVLDAAIKALAKEESDTSDLKNDRDRMTARIKSMAPNKDAGKPSSMVDIYAQEPYDYVAAPSRLRYNIQGNAIKFMQSYTFGDVY